LLVITVGYRYYPMTFGSGFDKGSMGTKNKDRFTESGPLSGREDGAKDALLAEREQHLGFSHSSGGSCSQNDGVNIATVQPQAGIPYLDQLCRYAKSDFLNCLSIDFQANRGMNPVKLFTCCP
jgi:hypothetical protein